MGGFLSSIGIDIGPGWSTQEIFGKDAAPTIDAAAAIGLAYWTGGLSTGAGTMAAVATYAAPVANMYALNKSMQAINSWKNGPSGGSSGGVSSATGAARAQGILLNETSNIDPIPVVYGTRKVGGSRVLCETSGSSNEYLHIVIALCEGEINAITNIYLDDVLSTDAKFSGLVTTETHLGADAQAASSALVSDIPAKWTVDHKGSGVAYVYVRCKYSQSAFSGLPTITCEVKGRKVYDPRTGLTAYSNNPALCIRDYLTSARFGRGISTALVDDAAIIEAANYCDELVTIPTGTQKRYTCDGVIDVNSTAFDNIKSLLTSCRGMLVYSGGVYKLVLDKPEISGFSFTEDNITGAWSISQPGRRSKYNRCTAGFFNPSSNWQPDYGISESTAFRAQDNDLLLEAKIDTPFTANTYTAQHLAGLHLKQSRFGISVQFTALPEALRCEVGDVVSVTHSTTGWVEKLFRVMQLSLKEDGEVDVSLSEYDATVYDLDTLTEVTSTPQASLPNPFLVGYPTALAATATNLMSPDGTQQSGIQITWTPPADAFVQQYEVQWIRGASMVDWGSITEPALTSSNWGLITSSADATADYGNIIDSINLGESEFNTTFVTTPYYVIPNAIAGDVYSVRVRAINSFGVRSVFASTNQVTYGDSVPPGAPSGLMAYGNYKAITLQWINPSDLDFDFVEVFRNVTNNPATATSISVIKSNMFVDAPLGINSTYFYWLKAVDRSGNVSVFSSVASATTQYIDSDSFSSSVMALFSEAGAYGIEPVASLPSAGTFNGQIKYDTTNNKLWRWDSATTSWTDDIFSITAGSVDATSFAAGVEPVKVVSSLPSASGYTGPKLVFNTTDGKLYRYVDGAWTSGVATGDLTGTIGASQFSNTLRPVEVVGTLPVSGNFDGRVVVLTVDSKLYRYATVGGWTASVSSADISGAITNAQIDGLAAAKLTGTIAGTQISDGAITTAKIFAGAITTAKIAAGAITASEIASGAIVAGKIAAGAVTASELAANSVIAGKIAAGAISATELASDSVIAGKIAAGAVNASQIAAGAISADKIAALAITTDKIAAGAIQSDKIAANSITAGLLAASGVITTAAQITDGVITNAKIANLSVDSTKIADAAITSAKIANLSVGTLQIANGAVTVSAFASDNGFNRYFTAGSFGAGSGSDTFATLTFPTQAGDDITVEVHFTFTSTSYNSTAGAYVALTPYVHINGANASSYAAAAWGSFHGTAHAPLNLKVRVVGTGSPMTASLLMGYAFGAFTNPGYASFKVSNCIISAFGSRK
jgi:hypothetical protein